MRVTGKRIVGLRVRAVITPSDPFFTTKPSGEGTGLGLAISHEIAHEHSGSIRADNHPDGGAVFIVTLPRQATSAAKSEAP